jgi:hypothetical protein
MDGDLLNLRKKRFVSDVPVAEPSQDSPDYQAFSFEAHTQRRVRIVCQDGINHSPSYMYLADIVDNGPAFTRVALVFSHYVYRCDGKYMQHLVELLNEEKVKRIVEFDPKRWKLPDAGETIITRIEVRLRADPSLADILGVPPGKVKTEAQDGR